MTTATRPAMPAEFSDDLDLALYRETKNQVPNDQRSTCPLHLNWRDHCRQLHDR